LKWQSNTHPTIVAATTIAQNMLVARLGGDASASPEPDGLKAPPPPRFSVSLSQPAKNATLFLSFPYVCPEPVLVKRSFYI
jgi:hypothetical protein